MGNLSGICLSKPIQYCLFSPWPWSLHWMKQTQTKSFWSFLLRPFLSPPPLVPLVPFFLSLDRAQPPCLRRAGQRQVRIWCLMRKMLQSISTQNFRCVLDTKVIWNKQNSRVFTNLTAQVSLKCKLWHNRFAFLKREPGDHDPAGPWTHGKQDRWRKLRVLSQKLKIQDQKRKPQSSGRNTEPGRM